MINKMVNHPPSITSERPTATTVSVSSVKASSTKAFRPGTTAAVNLNARLLLTRQILLNSSPTLVATRDGCLLTLATRRHRLLCLLLHNRLSLRRPTTGRSNMLTIHKEPSKPTRKSSPRAWTSQATLAASSDLGNCSLETLTGMATDLLLPPLLLQFNPRPRSRWVASLWTNPAAMANAVVLGMIASSTLR